MNKADDPINSPESAQDSLLNRLLRSEKIGALIKGVGVFIKDYSTGDTIPNTFWRELGYSGKEMTGDRWIRYVHPDDAALVKGFNARLLSGAADSWEGEYRVRSRSGEYRTVRHKALILERKADGVPSLYVGWDVDVTEERARVDEAKAERDKNELKLLRSETIRNAGAILSSELDPVRAADRVLAQASRVLSFDEASIWIIDGERLLRLASRGYSAADIGRRETLAEPDLRSLLEMRSPRITAHPYDTFQSKMEIPLLVRGEMRGLLSFRSLKPDEFGPEEVGAAVQFADHAVVAIANALRYRAAEIEAATDWLTGLPTRRSFMARLGRLKDELEPTVEVSALMIDLDRFKEVNDTYGHPVGDMVLCSITSICRDSLRTNDLCCRYGGEEVLAILPFADGETAFSVAERLRERVETLRYREYPDLRLTVSVGIHTGAGGSEFRQLIERADEALYMAKSAGRNRCEVR